VLGLGAGGALAHTLGLASAAASDVAPGGPTSAGRVAVAAGFVFALAYASAIVRSRGARSAAGAA
jgi:hypothetical protein